MNLANKTFKDNKTGEIIKVIDSFENIAILENKDKVDVRKLMDNNYYTEQIDPTNFFNNQGAYNSLADKIKSIPADKMGNDVEDIAARIGGDVTPATNESAIIISSEDDERAELARKYGASVDNISSTNRQNEAFAKLLGEEGSEELPVVQVRHTPVNEPSVQHIEVNRDQPVQRIDVVSDPIVTIFKGAKRNIEFKMNLEVSNKIPRLDFIEMMEDSYEVSIIDFLAEEFTNDLLRNPQHLKAMISDRIKQVVYAGDVKKKSEPKVESKVVESKVESPKEQPKKVVKKTTRRTTKKQESE